MKNLVFNVEIVGEHEDKPTLVSLSNADIRDFSFSIGSKGLSYSIMIMDAYIKHTFSNTFQNFDREDVLSFYSLLMEAYYNKNDDVKFVLFLSLRDPEEDLLRISKFVLDKCVSTQELIYKGDKKGEFKI